jgi:hypothetical protein
MYLPVKAPKIKNKSILEGFQFITSVLIAQVVGMYRLIQKFSLINKVPILSSILSNK